MAIGHRLFFICYYSSWRPSILYDYYTTADTILYYNYCNYYLLCGRPGVVLDGDAGAPGVRAGRDAPRNLGVANSNVAVTVGQMQKSTEEQ